MKVLLNKTGSVDIIIELKIIKMTKSNMIILPPYFTEDRIKELQQHINIQVERVLLFYSYLMYNYLALARYEKVDYHDYRITKFISVHSEKLGKIFGRANYRYVLKTLKCIGLLEIDESYHQGIFTETVYLEGKTKQYKVPIKLLNNTYQRGWIKYELKDAKSINAKKCFINFLRKNKADSIRLSETSKRVIIDSLKKVDTSLLPKNNFYDNFTGPGMDKFGNRVHSILTNLKREFRPLIKFSDSDESLVEIDIKMSQLYFLANLSTDWIFKVLRPFDAAKFEMAIQDLKANEGYRLFQKDILQDKKDIYQRYADEFDIDRQEAKEKIYAILFSSPYGQKGEIFKSFERDYPGMIDELNKIKSIKINSSPSNKRHSNLTLFLQRIESNIVLDQIIEQVAQNGITDILTVHDSWLIKSSLQKEFKQIAESVFDKNFGNIPRLEVKN